MDSNMDIGATTPAGFIAAGFVTDPSCTHSGDTGFSGGAGPFQERMECTLPSIGPYTIVVENYTANALDFLLSVTMDGVDVVDVNGTPLTDTYTMPANTNTDFGQQACPACDFSFTL